MRGVVWNPPSGHSMARMHARRKGRSGSRRPLGAKNPDWVPLEPDEVEETIMRLATGKSIVQVLRAQGVKMEVPEDLGDLMRRAVSLQSHLKLNPRDTSNRRGLQLLESRVRRLPPDHPDRRGLQLLESRIRRLARYYQDRGVLPASWDYSVKIQELATK